MKKIKTIQLFYRDYNKPAAEWARRIDEFRRINFPEIEVVEKDADGIIVLGGDGAILEAARKYKSQQSVILGLNLGTVGFLASVRDPEHFLAGVNTFFQQNFIAKDSVMLTVDVKREGETIFTGEAMNDVVVQNLLGMVDLDVSVEEHAFQNIRGTGVLIATPTGSTAYNLSAHGPILMPEMKAIIVTELLDHNIPTPSLVVKDDKEIEVAVKSFRSRDLLSFKETGEVVDVLLILDGEAKLPLREKDLVLIKKADTSLLFAEIEKNYFLKSLKEKFSFK